MSRGAYGTGPLLSETTLGPLRFADPDVRGGVVAALVMDGNPYDRAGKNGTARRVADWGVARLFQAFSSTSRRPIRRRMPASPLCSAPSGCPQICRRDRLTVIPLLRCPAARRIMVHG